MFCGLGLSTFQQLQTLSDALFLLFPIHSRDVTNSCNSDTNAWQRLAIRNNPIHVSGHSVCTLNNEAWVFGGCGKKSDGRERCFNDLHRFNPETAEWVKVEPGPGSEPPPLPRRSCAMCSYKSSSLIIAGGAGDNPEDLMSDIYEFNVPTRRWRKIVSGADAAKLCLCGQSAIWVGGSSLLFFGGSTGLEYTSDLVEVNVDLGAVRTIQCTGDLPSARYKHQVEIHGGGMWLIGGGDFRPREEELYVYFLDFSDLQWHCIKTNGDIPKGRVAHSCSYDPVEGVVYVWGGFTSALTCVPSLDKFIFETKTWVRLDECRETREKVDFNAKSSSPIARSFHGSAFLGGTLYSFFGSNGSQKLRDVWAWR